jgi:hypothetical protein
MNFEVLPEHSVHFKFFDIADSLDMQNDKSLYISDPIGLFTSKQRPASE